MYNDNEFSSRGRQYCQRIEEHAMNYNELCNCALKAPSKYDQSLEEIKFQNSACALAQRGEHEKLSIVIEKRREKVNETDNSSSGYTPLHYASRNGNIECVKVLLQKKFNCAIDQGTLSGNVTALMRASLVGHYEISKLLLDSNARKDLVDDDGDTALHKAHKGLKLLINSNGNNNSEHDRKRREYDKIINALVEAYPEAQFLENKRGLKPSEV